MDYKDTFNERDVSLGLLLLILDLARRIDKLEEVTGIKDKDKENKIKADAEEIRKEIIDRDKKRQKELDEEREAKIEKLNAEIRKLEAEFGMKENINKAMPFPTYGTAFPCWGCDPFGWR